VNGPLVPSAMTATPLAPDCAVLGYVLKQWDHTANQIAVWAVQATLGVGRIYLLPDKYK